MMFSSRVCLDRGSGERAAVVIAHEHVLGAFG
jgi:hypothetical protein